MKNFLDNKCENCVFYRTIRFFPAWFQPEDNLTELKKITKACVFTDDNEIIVGLEKHFNMACEEFQEKKEKDENSCFN